jgi:hypothetical protein
VPEGRQRDNELVLFFELFPAFITLVATAIAIALFVVSRTRRGSPERPAERPDPSRAAKDEGRRFVRPSMRG